MAHIYTIEDLVYLMERLRDPDSGCPWDKRQTYSDIVPFTLEECYELADTIERADFPHLQEELGDVLFQVIFYARLAQEEQRFDFNDIVATLVDKLVRRHPHVFPAGQLRAGGVSQELVESEVKQNWEALKREERCAKSQSGVLDDVPLALPALTRARKLQKRAAGVGFDWPDVAGVEAKLDEEMAELSQAIALGDKAAIEDEAGDLLFTVVNYARHLGVDPETALRKANRKFQQRFELMEANLSGDNALDSISAEQWEHLWQIAKQQMDTNSNG